MKKTLFTTLLLALATWCAAAQDLITLRDGTDIEARVLEVGDAEIRYRRADNPDGPSFVLPISDLLLIRYANGANQTFLPPDTLATPVGQARSIVPGMKYGQYQSLYNPALYVRQRHDPYLPAVSGICSALIPGLGQMVSGEVGRGLAWFGGAVGSIVLPICGVAYLSTYTYHPQLAVTLLLCIPAAYLAVDICSVVDAVRVAKVKNMYVQDLRRTASTLNVRLQPYVSAFSNGFVQTPVAGLSLAVSF